VAKLTAMSAAGDAVDVSLSPMQYLASYLEQGIAQPIDGLPGVDQYVKDFTPFTRAIAQRDGKTWGLPYFSTVWTFIYNDEMLAKAGFRGRPFTSYPELNDQAQSPIAGKGRALALPGDGKTIGYTMLYILCSATKNKEWAWKLLQYLGGRTKSGEYTQANRLATDAMLGSGYQSVMDSELL